jgi:hypothetical protein
VLKNNIIFRFVQEPGGSESSAPRTSTESKILLRREKKLDSLPLFALSFVQEVTGRMQIAQMKRSDKIRSSGGGDKTIFRVNPERRHAT